MEKCIQCDNAVGNHYEMKQITYWNMKAEGDRLPFVLTLRVRQSISSGYNYQRMSLVQLTSKRMWSRSSLTVVCAMVLSTLLAIHRIISRMDDDAEPFELLKPIERVGM